MGGGIRFGVRWSSAFLPLSSESPPSPSTDCSGGGAAGTLAGASRASGDISSFLHSLLLLSPSANGCRAVISTCPRLAHPLQSWALQAARQCLPAQVGEQEGGGEGSAPTYLYSYPCMPKSGWRWGQHLSWCAGSWGQLGKEGVHAWLQDTGEVPWFCSKTGKASH